MKSLAIGLFAALSIALTGCPEEKKAPPKPAAAPSAAPAKATAAEPAPAKKDDEGGW